MRPGRVRIDIAVQGTPPDSAYLDAWKSIEIGANHDFFLGHTWISAWLQASRPVGDSYLATIDGAPVGAAIISRPAGSLRGLLQPEYRMQETGITGIDGLYIEYNGILAHPEFAQECLREFVRALRPQSGGLLHRLTPSHLIVSAASPSFTRLMQSTFPDVRIFKKDQCPYIDLSMLRAEQRTYLSSLSANTRRQLNLARRGFETIGPLELERADTVQQAMTFLGELKPLHVARWRQMGKSSAYDNPVFEPFLKALVEVGVPSGALDVLRASTGGKPFGYLVNFSHRGACLNYTSGFAYGEFADLKPGLMTHLLAIEAADRNGKASYNFLAGAARYKTSLSTGSDELSWLKLRL